MIGQQWKLDQIRGKRQGFQIGQSVELFNRVMVKHLPSSNLSSLVLLRLAALTKK
jgi:hypothetical protein